MTFLSSLALIVAVVAVLWIVLRIIGDVLAWANPDDGDGWND